MVILLIWLIWLAAAPQKAAEIKGLIHANRYLEALAEVDAALAKGPEDLALREFKARALYGLGHFPRCEAELKSLIEEAPPEDHPALLLRLADSQLAQGAFAEAAVAAEKALARAGDGPRAGEIKAAAGGIFYRAQDYRRAIPLLDAALADRPKHPFLSLARGVARSRIGDYRGALADLEAAEADQDLRLSSLYESGLALAKLDDSQGAIEKFVQVLEEDPYHSEACYHLVRQLLKLHKIQLAGSLQRYFLSLKEREGASSRDHHFAAIGQPVLAALERAQKWERLRRFDRVLGELSDAEARHGPQWDITLARASFWLRMGLAAEARSEIERLKAIPGAAGSSAALEKEIRSVESQTVAGPPPSEQESARLKNLQALARARKQESLHVLLALIDSARSLGRGEEAYRFAMLAHALFPGQQEVLAWLVKLNDDPATIFLKVRALRELLKIDPQNAGARRQLEEARRLVRAK
ncbi:MAG: tetratricopeptide repeat protein [Planctomycetes bacterium]|nr:tetratricopeptide repeat protein [Planctomycetota bacterium]